MSSVTSSQQISLVSPHASSDATSAGIGDGCSAAGSRRNDRYEPRFMVFGDDNKLNLACNLTFRPTEDRAFRIPCDLVDLNSSGCAIRYRLPRPLPQGPASTMLEIKNLSENGSIQMLARVRWSRQTGIDQFTSGLYFRRSLPDEFITGAVKEGQLTRRKAKRNVADVPVSIRQSQPQLSTDATIVSTSQIGVQVVAAVPLNVGARLMLQLADGTAVVGKTAWCTAQDDRYASGIAFIKVATGRVFDEAVIRKISQL